MIWDFRLSKSAAKDLRKFPRAHQEQIAAALEEMRTDPFQGDVLPIKSGKFQGALRKRAGRYRIVFALDRQEHLIEVAAILLRSEDTYR